MSRRPDKVTESRPVAPIALTARKTAWQTRALAGGFSLAVHGAILTAILLGRGEAPKTYDLDPVALAMIASPPPPPKPPAPPAPKREPAKAKAKKAAPAPPKPAKPEPKTLVRKSPTPPPANIETLQVRTAPKGEAAGELGEAQLIGAVTAGSGSGGGGQCNMVRRLQDSLRNDPKIHNAVARAYPAAGTGGRAIRMWDGDWVRSPGEDEGKGLAGVREAIMVEVAFAPKACRTEPVRGIVVISLNDGPGAARLALGSGTWRWSDLLFAR